VDSGHLSFSLPIHAFRPIDALLHLRNTATMTWVEQKCFLESAEQAGLRRRSTVRHLTDAIVDDSYSQVHLASSTDTFHQPPRKSFNRIQMILLSQQ